MCRKYWFERYHPKPQGGTISRGELIIYDSMATPDISRSSENISNTAGVSRLSFHFLWLWCDSEEPI